MIQLQFHETAEEAEYRQALAQLRTERLQVERARIVLEECERREQEAWLRVLKLEQVSAWRGN